MGTPVYAELEITLSHTLGGEYEAELRFTSPASEAEIPPVRSVTPLDLDKLLEHQHDPRSYGAALTEALFADEKLRSLYGQVRAAVETGGLTLRLRLRVDASAQELHALRWELLRAPAATAGGEPGALLSTSERILFSRFMASSDWRSVKIARKADLRAVVAVAAPTNLAAKGLAEIDIDAEIARARAGLEGAELTVASRDEPLTLERLVELLRDGNPDILYLVAHGALSRRTGEGALYLQDADGKVAVCRGRELAERVAELVRPPRLAVLVSCESAGTESGDLSSALAALAPLLADAGVAAVLAMQGRISMPTMEKALPVFFRELLHDGQIDRALAVARGAVRDRADAWMPALFMRLKRGRIWYEPGFSDDEGDFSKWRSIVSSTRQGNFVPILGPDVGEHVYGTMHEMAERLGRRHAFPLAAHDRGDLAKVTQFLSVRESRSLARDEVMKNYVKGVRRLHPELAEAGPLSLPKLLDRIVERQSEDDPFQILAGLPAKVYVNACPDPLLIKTLKARGREPRPLLCDWRPSPDHHPTAPTCDQEPTAKQPVVHHVFGVLGKADSLVMNEDDFFDYLIAAAEYKLIPGPVRGALTRGSLLFLGFRLDDWTFRVLFRLIMALGGQQRLRDYAHVAVQVDPEEHDLTDVEPARRYLDQYFSAGRDAPPISIYWGSSQDFLAELRRRMDEDTVDEPSIPAEEDDDGWLD